MASEVFTDLQGSDIEDALSDIEDEEENCLIMITGKRSNYSVKPKTLANVMVIPLHGGDFRNIRNA